MVRRKLFFLTLALLAIVSIAGTAFADSISPASFSAAIDVGGIASVDKTVTINAGAPTTTKVDVYFLADTTGSMGGTIGAVAGSASTILSGIAALGDVNFGVGEYKDFGDSYAYRLNTAMTSSASTAQSGIGMWSASGGGDYQEADLYALYHVAADSGTGWRGGSSKIVVWFGDASGHDPSGGITEADATAALVGGGIKVEAINVGTMNDTGQCTRITTATGGTYYAGIDSSSIVDTIKSAISASFLTYKQVALDLSEVPAGLEAIFDPSAFSGAFDRSLDRTFEFALSFKGLAEGVYDFNVYALVDGARVATEAEHIVVGTPTPTPEPATMLLLGSGLLGLAGFRRKNK